MNVTDIKSKIIGGYCDETFSLLYSDLGVAQARYAKACDSFVDLFGNREDIRIFSAPGRTEVGGNHTDHQHGRVLAGSVNLDVIAIVAPNDDGVIRIKSEGYNMDMIHIDELEAVPGEKGRAISLIRGMCAYFKINGYEIGGFDAYTTSNVLKGSGLSSSAAFEVLIGTILNFMYNDAKIEPVEIAKISQKSESLYFGKPCGLLDQTASASGGFTAIDFKDTTNPKVERIEFDLKQHGYVLCVVDTGGNHANLTQDYADITIECRDISNAFGKDFLRDVNPNDFYSRLGELRQKKSDRAILRAIHFFDEDQRAEDEKQALLSDDFDEFLRLVNESGNSSFKYLQNIYSNSDVSEQGLSLGLALTERFLKGKGACRVHGGGFAGTIQCYIPENMMNDYVSMIEAVFGKGSCNILNIRSLGGCEIVSK